MAEYIIAIDAGTTSNRVMLFDSRGNVAASASREFPQIYPTPGWVEHDGMVIWNDVRELLEEVYAQAKGTVAAIGIANQRESVVVWEVDSGVPLHNVIVWQDRRGASICEELRAEGMDAHIQERTGLVVDAYFSASKLAWLFREDSSLHARAERGEIVCGTIDTWLLYCLTAGVAHATDYTNASRTMLYDIRSLQWDERILKRLNIPSNILPSVLPSSHLYGTTAPRILDGAAVPITGIAGDQHAALFGQACFRSGMAKNTYGTGNFALLNIGDRYRKSAHRLLTTIAWGIGGRITYALEGAIFITGAAIQWLRDGIGIIADAAESEALATSVDSNNGVYFVPAFVEEIPSQQ